MSAFGSGPSNGQFWYGSTTNFPGFLYKKNVGVGGKRSTKMGPGGNITCNSSTDLYNKYKPGGGGVGASSTANRRAKNRLASVCGSNNKCFPCYNTLGQYSNYTHNPNGFVPCPGTINISSGSSPTPGPSPSGTYTVTYLGNTNTGGTAPTDGSSPYNSGTSVSILGNSGTLVKLGTPPTPLTNSQFGGWNTAPNGSGTNYVGGDTFNITQNTILYAQWLPPMSGVQLVYNFGTNGSGTAPSSSGTFYPAFSTQPVVDNTGTFTRSGFTFAGWNTAANGSETSYPVGSNVTMANISSLITLYAQWIPDNSPNVTLTYDGNGSTSGSVPVDGSSPYIAGSPANILGNTGSLTKDSLVFNGWNTVQNPTTLVPGISYPAGSVITMTANTTLYAQWVDPNTNPLVTYDKNAITATGSVPAQPTYYANNVQVPILGQGSLTNPGYTFLGWQDASGSLYAPGYTFTSKTVTLLAQWAPGSTIKSCAPTETYATELKSWYDIPYAQVIADTTFATQTITIFLAAYLGTEQSNVGTGVGPYGIKSFVSKTVITSTSIINNTYTTYLTEASNNNYSQTILNSTANYWPTTPGATISSITFPSINVNSSIPTSSNIISNPATFNRATFIVSNGCGIGAQDAFITGGTVTQFYFFNQGLQLNFLNGTSTTSTQIVNCPVSALYKVGSTLTAMPKSNYPYVGITPATHNTLTCITILPSSGSKSISPPIPDVSLQYNANGLSGENGAKNNISGTPSAGGLPAPTYFETYNTGTSVAVGGNVGANSYYLTKKNSLGNEFIFTKWNTAADGSGTDYGPGFTTTYLSSSGSAILYAQWIPGYYVNYDGNGNTAPFVGAQGVGDVLSPYPTTGSSVVTVRANTSPVGSPGPFTKTGYSFSSWNTAASGTGTSYVGGNTFTITQNTDLYAQWILNPFSTTGGSTTSYTSGTFVITFTSSGTMTFNSGITMPATVNYLLVGGGGGGGKNTTAARGGGGGAGGQVITATNVLTSPTTTLTFTVAQASGFIPSNPANGFNTQLSGTGITTIIASGGLVGGDSTSTVNGIGGIGSGGGGNGGNGGTTSTAGANGGIGTAVNINGTTYYFGGGGAGGNGSTATPSAQGGQGGGGGSGTGSSAINPIGNANINPYLGPNNISQGTSSAGYNNSGGGGAGANGGSSFGWKAGGSGLAVVWFSYP
jgi:uncharacterized repeat protein (TIGR02543 family)